MKIIYIVPYKIPSKGANGIQVMKMCQAFARNNHTVTLIVSNIKNKNDHDIKDIFEYYGVEKLFEIIYLPANIVKISRFLFGYFAAKTAKQLKPDLVYCRTLAECYFSMNRGFRSILESHLPNDKGRGLKGFFKKCLFKSVVTHHNFIRIIAITKSIKDYYEKSYPFLQNRIQVAPDGADPYPDNITPVVLPNTGERMQVGYTGHLHKDKGMKVISILAPLYTWADFHVVGGSKEEIDHWKTECKEADNLFFHGYIPHNEVGRYTLAFDVLLLPNQEKMCWTGEDIAPWTSPLKAFEYMAAKKPIVASDLPVLHEVFTDNVNALLAPPENIKFWAECIHRLHEDKELSLKIADNAYNDFINKYTWLARARNILNGL